MMRFDKRYVFLLGLVLLLISVCACSPESETNGNDSYTPLRHEGEIPVPLARVVVTADFGNCTYLDECIHISPGMTTMDGLQQVADVATKYGGGFIHDIDDIRSVHEGRNSDWFVYSNGIQADTGADGYDLHSGDIVHLDFHEWGFRQFIPAIIGDFPEPFLHGYAGEVRPTIVVYEDAFGEAADEIAATLAECGVADICAKGSNELSPDEKQYSNLIIVGDKEDELIAEMNKVWDRLGFFAYFADDVLVVMDSRGNIAGEYDEGTGLIQATQNQWNSKGIGACENVVWMVSGTDNHGVHAAIDTLVNRHSDLTSAFAVIVADGVSTTLPPDG